MIANSQLGGSGRRASIPYSGNKLAGSRSTPAGGRGKPVAEDRGSRRFAVNAHVVVVAKAAKTTAHEGQCGLSMLLVDCVVSFGVTWRAPP